MNTCRLRVLVPHKDYPAFGPTIACVSLGSDIILDFTPADRSQRIPVNVPARSLWVITGDARAKWLHGIAPRLTDRFASRAIHSLVLLHAVVSLRPGDAEICSRHCTLRQ